MIGRLFGRAADSFLSLWRCDAVDRAAQATVLHEPSEATRRGGYTIADIAEMRAEIDRNRWSNTNPYTAPKSSGESSTAAGEAAEGAVRSSLSDPPEAGPDRPTSELLNDAANVIDGLIAVLAHIFGIFDHVPKTPEADRLVPQLRDRAAQFQAIED